MTDPYHLAPLDPTEAPAVAALHALLQAGDDAPTGPVDNRSAAELQAAMDDWIACWGPGGLVGALASHPDPDDDAVVRLATLVTHPQHRRQGVATRLLHAAVVALGRRQALAVHLPRQHPAAAGLLRAAGFRPWGPGGGPLQAWLRPPG